MGDKPGQAWPLSAEAIMNIQFRSRGKCGMWYYRIKGGVLPKPIWFSAKTTVESQARKIGHAKMQELETAEKAGDLVERPALTAEILCNLDQARARSEASNSAYITFRIPEYWDALGGFFKDFYNVTSSSIHAYVSSRIGPDPLTPRYTNQTIQKELHTLVRGLNLAVDNGYKVNVPRRVPKLRAHPKAPERTAKFFTADQMISFVTELMRIDGRGSTAPFALAVFALGTGWRAGEFAGLSRVTFTEPKREAGPDWRMMTWPEGVRKSKKPGSMAVPALVAQLVAHLPRPGANYRGAWRVASRRAGLPAVPTLRCLRHTFATAAASGGDEYGVDLAMDHARPVKSRYQHPHEDRMRRILAALMADYGAIFGWPEGQGRQKGDK